MWAESHPKTNQRLKRPNQELPKVKVKPWEEEHYPVRGLWQNFCLACYLQEEEFDHSFANSIVSVFANLSLEITH